MEISEKNNYIHLHKQCSVIIRKPKLRIFDEYDALVRYIQSVDTPTPEGWNTLKTEEIQKQKEKYKNVIFKKGEPPSSKNRVLQEVEGSNFWYIISNGYLDIEGSNMVENLKGDTSTVTNKITTTSLNNILTSKTEKIDNVGIFNVNSDVNNSVISVDVNQANDTAWTATITMDNTDDIYYLKNTYVEGKFYFQEGDCVIEANDEVEIYLTDWDGILKQVFKGFVNSISTPDDGLSKRIRLQCEDDTKKLSVSRTNINPSLSPLEAQGDDISIFTVGYAQNKPEEIIKYILGRTYCNILTDFNFIYENKDLIKRLRNPKDSDKVADLKKFKENVFKKLDDGTYITYIYENEISGSTSGSLDLRNPYQNTVTTNNKTIKKILGYEYIDGIKRLKFVIDGINQPAWAIEFNQGGWDYLVSQWKSNDEVINSIVDAVYYEFFCNENGVIYVRPTNLSLPKSIDDTNDSYYWPYKNIQKNYIISKDKEVYVKNFDPTFNDRSIFTEIVISGQFVPYGQSHPFLRRLVIGPYKWIKKFGTRMAPQESKIGAISQEQMEAYGQARLMRHNSEAWTASLFLEGNSQLVVGKPIFIERWQSVYYITGVSHYFKAGDEYTTNLTLNNRRKPLAFIDKNVNLDTALARNLSDMVDRNEISETEKTEIIKHKSDLQWGTIKIEEKDYNVIWEHIPSIFDVGKLQLDDATRSVLLQEVSESWKNYQNALSQNSNVEYYKSVYDKANKSAGSILNKSWMSFNTDTGKPIMRDE